MGIPEELKRIEVERKGVEGELSQRQWEYDKGYNSGEQIGGLTERVEGLKVKEQGLVDTWNAEQLQLTDQKIQSELSADKRRAKKAYAQGGHPEGYTMRSPPKRASAGTTKRYAPRRKGRR